MQPINQVVSPTRTTPLPATTNATQQNNTAFADLLVNAEQASSSNALLQSLLSTNSFSSAGALTGSTDPLASFISALSSPSSGTGTSDALAMLLSADMSGTVDALSNVPLSTVSPTFPSVTIPTSTGQVQSTDIVGLIDKMAPQYGLSPSLVAAVVNQESGYNPSATSSAGAMGLMQLMPSTANGLGVTNAYDPVQNLQGGMTYLRQLLTRYHNNTALALAAYNAGPSAVDAYHGIPPYEQTQNYVSSILAKVSGATL